MPRPRKFRRVCCLPDNAGFNPLDGDPLEQPVILTVDEYEAIRLIDQQGLSQEQCGEYMKIARTTVQQIYSVARKKLADALVDGRPLRIRGGDYRLCQENENFCPGCCCRRHRRLINSTENGGNPMKIAIPLDDTKKDVCVSFGRAPYFLFSENGNNEILENPAAEAQGGAGLQAAQFVVDHGAGVLITVRCGQNAADVFQAAGMKIYKNCCPSAEENLAAFADGKLEELTHFHEGYHGIR